MKSLASFYRPQSWSEIVGQESIVLTLKKQLQTNNFKNAYLLSGPSGDGKTTIARCFAKDINKGFGTPIEIDAASNNGVDNIRLLIEESKSRALDCEYKVIIIDECHSLTIQAWQALLKTIEEPSPFTIFIFCTTELQKVPDTIQNRCCRFNLTKISTDLIIKRLEYICSCEGLINYKEACNYIARLADGGMRNAISMLEKCADYNTDLSIENIITVLGNFSYNSFITITNNLIDGNQKSILAEINSIYNNGKDLKLFIDQYLEFIIDITKYIIFGNIMVTKLPASLEKQKSIDDVNCIQYVINIDNNIKFFNDLATVLLQLKNIIKTESNPKSSIEVTFINICRGLMKCY